MRLRSAEPQGRMLLSDRIYCIFAILFFLHTHMSGWDYLGAPAGMPGHQS
jgi:hypothetical protein